MCVHVELRTALTEHELDQIACEAAQAVTVGNIHRAYSPCKDVCQKPSQSSTVEVEATGNVAVDAGPRVPLAQGLDLPLEVLRLLAGGHSGIDSLRRVGLLWLVGCGLPPSSRLLGGDAGHVVEAVLASPVPRETHGVDEPTPGPAGQGLAGDAEDPAGLSGPDPRSGGVAENCDMGRWGVHGLTWGTALV